MSHAKCVLVGDGRVGKSAMLDAHCKGAFRAEYLPTVMGTYETVGTADGGTVHLTLHDTAGPDDYARLRPVSYPEANVIIIVFSVVNRASLKNVHSKWVPELKLHAPGVPVLLVGTHLDLRADAHRDAQTIEAAKPTLERLLSPRTLVRLKSRSQNEPISSTEGRDMAVSIGAVDYLECSSRTFDGLRPVFDAAARATLSLTAEGRGLSRRSLRPPHRSFFLLAGCVVLAAGAALCWQLKYSRVAAVRIR